VLSHQVDLVEACRTVGADVAIWGNIDPVGVLARGTPDDVRQAANETIRTVDKFGHRRFVLSSGCTLAMETPSENLQALIAAAKNMSL